MRPVRFNPVPAALAALVALAGGRANPALAQSGNGLGTIVGRVMNDVSHRAVGNVTIRVDAIASVRTSPDGTFLISGISPGLKAVSVEARGYEGLGRTIPVTVVAGRTVVVPGPIALHPSAGP